MESTAEGPFASGLSRPVPSAEERLFKLSYPEPFTEGNTAYKQTLLRRATLLKRPGDRFCVTPFLELFVAPCPESSSFALEVIRRLFKLWSPLEPLPINRLHRRLEFRTFEVRGSRMFEDTWRVRIGKRSFA